MKKLLFLSLSVIALLGLRNIVFASASEGPSCTVAAKVVYRGTEKRKVSGADGKVKEYESKYVTLEVQGTKRKGIFGNCDFVKNGDIFKLDGGGNPHLLRAGDAIDSGVESLSSMGPSGAVLFIN